MVTKIQEKKKEKHFRQADDSRHSFSNRDKHIGASSTNRAIWQPI